MKSFDDFLAAIEMGDMAVAASILRQFSYLAPSQIEEICDLLDPNLSPELARNFPSKLVRAQRTQGRPAATPTDILFESFETSAAVAKQQALGANLKNALHEVSLAKKTSSATIKRQYQAGNRIKRPHKRKK